MLVTSQLTGPAYTEVPSRLAIQARLHQTANPANHIDVILTFGNWDNPHGALAATSQAIPNLLALQDFPQLSSAKYL